MPLSYTEVLNPIEQCKIQHFLGSLLTYDRTAKTSGAKVNVGEFMNSYAGIFGDRVNSNSRDYHHINEDTKRKVLELYAQGNSLYRINKILGLTNGATRGFLIRQGVYRHAKKA